MIAELLTWDFRIVLQAYLAWTIGITAILLGGGPERAVAFTWLLLFELITSAQDLIDTNLHFLTDVDVFLATVDAFAAAAWVTIALYANRNYTLWIAAMQVVAVSAHLASGIVEPISPKGYAVMVVAPGWIQLLLLAIGLTAHISRIRKFGPYRDWRIAINSTHPFAAMKQASYLSLAQAAWRERIK